MTATSVTVGIPIAVDGKISYRTITYVVGEEAQIPNVPYQRDKLIEIRVVTSWNPHVELDWESWGESWLVDNITSINYESIEHRKSILEKKRDK